MDERAFYIRLDGAKVNIAPRAGKATWFRLVGVPIGNATDEYPKGDTVQVVEPWSPPDIWADVNYDVINKILNTIAGTGDGNFYSSVAAAAADRAAWRVVLRFAPDKTEGPAREMIRAWRRSGVLEDFEYTNPKTRKGREGAQNQRGKVAGNFCANGLNSLAHHWRKHECADDDRRLRINHRRHSRRRWI